MSAPLDLQQGDAIAGLAISHRIYIVVAISGTAKDPRRFLIARPDGKSRHRFFDLAGVDLAMIGQHRLADQLTRVPLWRRIS